MSGGGSSSSESWRPATTNENVDDECDIFEQTVLNSPVPSVVSTLRVGQILHIDLETKANVRVVAKTSGDEIAGSITSAVMVDLMECIRNGHEYEAEVTSVQGGRIDIEIRRK